MRLHKYDGVDKSSNDGDCYQIIAKVYYPWIHEVQSRTGGKVLGGDAFNYLNSAAQIGNFCYNITLQSDYFFMFDPKANDSRKSVIGEVYYKKYDYLILPLTITSWIYKNMDASRHIEFTSIGAAYKYPTIDSDPSGFMKPFNLTTWALIGVFLVLVTLLVVAVVRVRNSIRPNKRRSSGTNAFGSTLMLTVKMLLGQSSDHNEDGGSQTLIFFWCITSLLIGMSYKCNLKAMLIAPKVEIPFTNLQEMVAQTKMPWSIVYGTIFHKTLKNAPPDSTFGRFYRGLTWTDNVREEVSVGRLTYVYAQVSVYVTVHAAYAETGKCTFKAMEESVMLRSSSFIGQKNSTLGGVMNRVITGFMESGIYFKLREMKLYYVTFCEEQLHKKQSIRKLSIIDLYIVFILLATGNLLGLVTFIGEVLYRYYANRHTAKTDLKTLVSIAPQ